MNDRQLDMVLGYLNEGIEINRDEYINEGFMQKLRDMFNKKKKPAEDCPKEMYDIVPIKRSAESSKVLFKSHSDLKEEILSYIRILDNGATYENNTINIRKSKYAVVEKTEVSVYKYTNVTPKENPRLDGYVCSNPQLIYQGSIIKLAKDHGYEININDTSKIESDRKKIYNKAIAAAKKVISEFKTHKEWEDYFDCFAVAANDDEDFFNEYLCGISDYFYIIDYDLWQVKGGNAREALGEKSLADAMNFIMNSIKKNIVDKIPEISGSDYYGDWDDGPFVVIVKQ